MTVQSIEKINLEQRRITRIQKELERVQRFLAFEKLDNFEVEISVEALQILKKAQIQAETKLLLYWTENS